MSNTSEEKEDELFQENNYSMYFDKRHIKEETPYLISEFRQKNCELLETHYETICPKKTLDESMVITKFLLNDLDCFQKGKRKTWNSR